MKEKKIGNSSAIGAKNVIIILLLGTLGQLAWSLENSWFNTYVYDNVTTNTQPIALMNALSAITATVTTFIMGALSDRVGKRKPFIRFGYAIWGIVTAAFILTGSIKNYFWATFMVVFLDCVMTFFGSTAYDACYNAWITDISNETNRGKVAVLVQIGLYMSIVLSIVTGSIVDKFGYAAFFVSIGALVTCLGFIFGSFVKEGESLKPTQSENGKGFIKGILSSFSKESLKKNHELFLVLFTVAAIMTSFQISFAYETIFANNYVGISKSINSAMMAPVVPVALTCAVISAKLCDKGKGRIALVIGPIVFALGAFLHIFAHDALSLAIGRVIMYGGMVSMSIACVAMFKNLTPADSRGHFEGVRMVFQVLLPMAIGPSVGSLLIEYFGLSPLIYIATGACSLLALIPAIMLFVRQTKERSNNASAENEVVQ